jgi:hypothetical protein
VNVNSDQERSAIAITALYVLKETFRALSVGSHATKDTSAIESAPKLIVRRISQRTDAISLAWYM